MSATAEAAHGTARKIPEKGKADRPVPRDGPEPRLVPTIVPVESAVLDMMVTPAYIEPDTARPPFDPGPGFERVVAPPALDCAEVDPATHELWLLQMPFSWNYDRFHEWDLEPQGEDGEDGDVLGRCTDEYGLRYRIVQEAPELARKHFAISAGRPAAAVARRVTLVAEEAFEAAAAASTAGAPMHSTGGEAIAALATEAGVTEAEVLAAARERAFGPVLHDPDTGAPVSTVSPALREAGTGAPAAAALSSRAGLDVNEKKKKKKKRRDSDSSAAGGEPGGARDGGLEQGAASPTQGRGKKQKKRMRSDS